MSIVVEHEKRRKKILEKSLRVFVDEGFENTTFQKIADYCGITRTTLYTYFKNKKEIFNYSIKQLLAEVEEGIQRIRRDTSLGSVEKISRVLSDIFKHFEEHHRLLAVLLDYLLFLSKSNVDPEQRVRRRIARRARANNQSVIDVHKRSFLAVLLQQRGKTLTSCLPFSLPVFLPFNILGMQ